MKRNFKRRLQKALQSLKSYKLSGPDVGIILGSGLGAFLEKIEGRTIPYSRINGYPRTTVKGHQGVLKIGERVAVCAGRFHLYEGYSADEVALPVFLLHGLGVKTLILTNAAGGINDSYSPGDLVLIRDHINLMGVNPLTGPDLEEFGPRFPDTSQLYSRELRALARRQDFLKLSEGVYAGMPGPCYETPAEIRMLKTIGADMVGMSTVPEALAACYLGMQVLGISCISNMAAGIGGETLDHNEVIKTGKQVAGSFTRLLQYILEAVQDTTV